MSDSVNAERDRLIVAVREHRTRICKCGRRFDPEEHARPPMFTDFCKVCTEEKMNQLQSGLQTDIIPGL